jgi:hypothetical protein
MRTSIASALLLAAAHIRAVWPRTRSTEFTLAPWASRTLIASAVPVRDAVMSAVSPPGMALFGSAPAASNRSTMVALPFTQASVSGVTP